MVRERLAASRDDRAQQLWVRINPLDTELALPDLAAVMAGAPDGVVLPKTFSAAEAVRLDHYLSALEVREGAAPGATQILVVATETARSLFTMDSFIGASPRIYGMTWGAEDLSAALGASTNRAPDGAYEDVYRLARTLCLAACKAAGTEPVDSVYPDFRDLEGLRAEALQGRRAGFTGKVAIHPAPGGADQQRPMRRRPRRSPTRTAWSRRWRTPAGPARSASTARCSTCPTSRPPATSWRWPSAPGGGDRGVRNVRHRTARRRTSGPPIRRMPYWAHGQYGSTA